MDVSRKRPRSPGRADLENSSVVEEDKQGVTRFKVPGLLVTEHTFRVPLDYSGKVPGEIDLFVRELTTPATALKKNLPYLLYLQGGPGSESPRPCDINGWFKTGTTNFRVLLMDQRGTGRSSPITVTNLAKRGGPQEQATYLTFFRADSIVRDAEHVRNQLVPKDNLGGRWSILGQSFGGFCAFTYLSFASQGLLEVMITGGIPPGVDMPCSAEAAYRALYRRVLQANQRYYIRFPGDISLVQQIVSHLARQPGGGVPLPSGSLLTPRLFQTIGLTGLGSGGGFERLHYLLECFFDSEGDVNPAFLKAFEGWSNWETNPLYVLLHEAIYCQGGTASMWAAHRVRQEPDFKDAFDAVASAAAGQPVYFTGEMVYPWFFDDIAQLRPYKEAANLLAAKTDWAPLYDTTALANNTIAVATATYVEDMYVDYNLAQQSAAHVRGLRQWHTSEYKHSGIRDDGQRVLERLLNMVRDSILLE